MKLTELKKCYWCGETKPRTLEHFYAKPPHLFQAWCKACGREVSRFQRAKKKANKKARETTG